MYWDTIPQREFIMNYHTLFPPSTYVAHTVEGLSYTKSHLPAKLPMPPISPENRTAHISSTVPHVLEVGKTSQEVL